jgi:modulator of FtsH protease HflC
MSYDAAPSLMERFSRNPWGFAGAALALLIIINMSYVVVPEQKQAIVIRLSKPDRIANQFKPKQDFGQTGAGVIGVIPFLEDVVWIDKRIRDIDMDTQQVLSTDQLRLNVDAYARYRIVDPLQMYRTVRTEERLSDQLKPILGSALRNELGKRPFAALLSPERGQVMDNIQAGLERIAIQYGAEIVDVRIKRADLPSGTPLESSFGRMRTARLQEAAAIEADGFKQAQIIRAEADAKASATYAASFGKDADFYDFYRAMQSYRYTFGPDAKGGTNLILSPGNDYLREFRGGNR